MNSGVVYSRYKYVCCLCVAVTSARGRGEKTSPKEMHFWKWGWSSHSEETEKVRFLEFLAEKMNKSNDVYSRATWQSRVLDLFATHCLILITGIEQKFMIMFKQAVVETWSTNAICKGIFRSWLGSNSTQIVCCVYLFGVQVWPVVMCVSAIQACCCKTKESKILLCCLTWHSYCFNNSHRYEACCSSDW